LDRPVIPWQPRRRRAFFVLIPLIDVMFLLLIFFMLSSQIAPYSLMPIRSIAQGVEGANDGEGAAAKRDIAIRVLRGSVNIAGNSIPMAELVPALDRLVSQGVTGFQLIAARSATVQDVVTALEALQAASVGNVTLVNVAGSAP
jgi:biopolymer transport protein ExbD